MKTFTLLKYFIFFFGQLLYSHICVIWVEDVEKHNIFSIVISDFILSVISYFTIKEISESGKFRDFAVYALGSIVGCVTGMYWIK
jgi:hypothetical protein